MKHGTAFDGNVIHHLSHNREVIATHSSRHHCTLIRNEVPEVGDENFKKSDLGNSAGISSPLVSSWIWTDDHIWSISGEMQFIVVILSNWSSILEELAVRMRLPALFRLWLRKLWSGARGGGDYCNLRGRGCWRGSCLISSSVPLCRLA